MQGRVVVITTNVFISARRELDNVALDGLISAKRLCGSRTEILSEFFLIGSQAVRFQQGSRLFRL